MASSTSLGPKLDQLMHLMISFSTRLESLEAKHGIPTPPPAQPDQSEQPQPKQQEQVQEQEEQCSIKNITENAPASTNSTVNTSLLSTTLHQAAKQIDRERTSHCSNGSQFHGYKSFRLRFLAKPYIYTVLASPPAYTRYAEEIEATGQG